MGYSSACPLALRSRCAVGIVVWAFFAIFNSMAPGQVVLENEQSLAQGAAEQAFDAFAAFSPDGQKLLYAAASFVDRQGSRNPPAKQRLIERLLGVPRKQPHANPALAVIESAGDELALVADEVHDLPVEVEEVLACDAGRLDAMDGRLQDPGMPAKERQGLFRPQNHAGCC